jgi:hypothetical protein
LRERSARLACAATAEHMSEARLSARIFAATSMITACCGMPETDSKCSRRLMRLNNCTISITGNEGNDTITGSRGGRLRQPGLA